MLSSSGTSAASKEKERAPKRQQKKSSRPGSKASSSDAKPKRSRGQPGARKYLQKAECDGEVYRVGDSAYVILTPGEYEVTEEQEPCEICGKARKRSGRREVPLLECDKCLNGFHLDCLDPPLTEVPEDDWLCPSCLAGKPITISSSGKLTARQKFLTGEWSLILIRAIWEAADGQIWFSGCWYYRPEETHIGREDHHGAREVFLSDQVDNNEIQCLERVVPVCRPALLSEHNGVNDVYTCEYEYDATLKRFRQLPEEASCEGEDASTASDSSDNEMDASFTPVRAAQNMQRGGAASRLQQQTSSQSTPSKGQGGELWIQRDSIRKPGRENQTNNLETSDLGKARRILTTTSIPSSLPGREAERSKIEAFVRAAVKAEDGDLGKCMYVSGLPGTGKTATVLEAVRSLQKEAEAKQLPKFRFVKINSLWLPTAEYAYTQLYQAWAGLALSPSAAFKNLEKLFNSKEPGMHKSGTIIVLLDEMDSFALKSQKVLYNLVEWPTLPGSRMAIIGIANTMDLPERLMPKIASRLGGLRTTFEPYNKAQLYAILTSRLDEAGVQHVFADLALNMACAQVGGFSGDVRQVLQLCQKAAEFCESEGCSQVGKRHVFKASNALFNTVSIQMLKDCSCLQKLLLTSLLVTTRNTGRGDAMLEDLVDSMQQIATLHANFSVTVDKAAAAARYLDSMGLLSIEHSWHRLQMELSLNVPYDQAVHALKTSPDAPWVQDLPL